MTYLKNAFVMVEIVNIFCDDCCGDGDGDVGVYRVVGVDVTEGTCVSERKRGRC